jgi:L-ascorbate metabolism protein UlaG (beta-lactamase superfamily)
MLPIGGAFPMDGPLAAKAAAMLRPRAAMPIHYATFPILAQDASAFTEALAEKAPACTALLPAPCQSVTFD